MKQVLAFGRGPGVRVTTCCEAACRETVVTQHGEQGGRHPMADLKMANTCKHLATIQI
jgi:hypothetical protein